MTQYRMLTVGANACIQFLIQFTFQSCLTLQIFYPYSIQTHENEFPGEDPNDCPRNLKRDEWVFQKIGFIMFMWYLHYFNGVWMLKSISSSIEPSLANVIMHFIRICTVITVKPSLHRQNTTGGGKQIAFLISWISHDIIWVKNVAFIIM